MRHAVFIHHLGEADDFPGCLNFLTQLLFRTDVIYNNRMNSITNDQNIQEWSSVSNEIIENFGDQGDFYRKHQLNPAILSLLTDVRGKIILDAGSGTGYLARLLAKEGAYVTGIEPATNLYNYAVLQEKKEPLGITYLQEDLSAWKPIPNTFDMVVSNMVFMDIPDYQSAIRNCVASLKQNGVFVFSFLHPCFEEDIDWRKQQYVSTKEYFEEYAVKQFAGHFFHRTLSSYINLIAENSCYIEKMIEPQLSKEIVDKYPQQERSHHVPLFLVIRAKKN